MTERVIELVRELCGTKCQCGSNKRSGELFCRSCYHSLPYDMKRALYRRLGNGYEEAYDAAVRTLKGD